MNLSEQAEDVLLLHFKRNMPAETISDIFSLQVSEVRNLIRTFASSFSNGEYLMNVINALSEMKARKRKKSALPLSQAGAKDLEIAELRRQLTEALIKAEFYEEMVNVAERTFNIPIRKKHGAK